MVLSRWASVVLSVAMLVSPAKADLSDEALMDFFGGHGCAVGPGSRGAALNAGFDEGDVTAFIETVRGAGRAVRHREWVMLPPELCTIRIPEITSEIDLSDPEVAAALSAPDAYAEHGSPGCFLDGFQLTDHLQRSRGWDEERAGFERYRLLAKGIRSGDIAFYSDSPLRTPNSYQVVTGACADVPNIEKIRRSNAFFVKNFDGLVRTHGDAVICGTDGAPPLDTIRDAAVELGAGEDANAWHYIEIVMIALALDWIEGATTKEKGTPRPPLCHYE